MMDFRELITTGEAVSGKLISRNSDTQDPSSKLEEDE